MFIGSTVHLVDAGIDSGVPLLQGSRPNDHTALLAERRHRVFVQQCKSLIQIIKWYEQGRVCHEDGKFYIEGACYEISEFSPNLDFSEAIDFDVGLG